MTRKALVVLSGGQDSTTCLYWAIHRFDEVYAVTFDYGQRHSIEISAALEVFRIAKKAYSERVKNQYVLNVRDILVSASPLTSDSKLDEYESFAAMEEQVGDRIEKTFVPVRNPFFLTIAFNRAVALGCETVVTGICEADNANYPDCTESFRVAMERALNEGLHGFRNAERLQFVGIRAPLMYMSKAATVKLATELPGCMEALAYSHTSYDGIYPPVGKNHSNLLRAKGFEEADVPDPLVLRAWCEDLMPLPSTQNYRKEKVEAMMANELKDMPIPGIE